MGQDEHGRRDAGRAAGVVAMVGAGQLARMTHQAAVDYGVTLRVLATGPDDPAVAAGAEPAYGTSASFEDLTALAAGADVVTMDHELVPNEHLVALERAGHHVRPGPAAFRLSQDKLAARRVLEAAGVEGLAFPVHADVHRSVDVVSFADAHGWPVVVKARGSAYDGRGVHVVTSPEEAAALVPGDGGDVAWMVEEHVDLAAEVAVVVARSPRGEVVAYPVVGTRQEDGMCVELVLPAPIPDTLAYRATRIATAIVDAIDATGIVAVELFVTADGTLLLNELAMRPHNSGHVTIEACETSQFHNHLRAVLGWPLGPTELRSPAATVNVVGRPGGGDPRRRVADALRTAGAHVHLYGKAWRPGRKLGHVTVLAGTTDDALERARVAARLLEGA
ncbi:MAG: 5-(carboxyamino)imidazole ribonucleotide synthase [Actinomycetota bacterium]|jgi:5-(carboxyamino)imidazole ribonucleotide synthase|nr:5-(carboxyamino)imidazole ribonucleotide synthase [Actinomycetota bacterium]